MVKMKEGRNPANRDGGLCECACSSGGACRHDWSQPALMQGVGEDGTVTAETSTSMCTRCGMFKWDHDNFYVTGKQRDEAAFQRATAKEQAKIDRARRFLEGTLAVGDAEARDFAHRYVVKPGSEPVTAERAPIPKDRTKIVTICGSSRFVDVMAVVGWFIERDERAIVLGLHLIPSWYPDCPRDHLAEHDGVKEQLDALHLRKIDISDEVFVCNVDHYLGESSSREVEYAMASHIPIRWFTDDAVGAKVAAIMPGRVDVHRANRQFERMFPGAPKENE